MRPYRMLALGASLLVLVLSACSTGGGSTPTPATSVAPATAAAPSAAQPSTAGAKPTIKIGSDGFYEAKIMAEIYAEALEANGYTVDRSGFGLGGRPVTAPALESGQIDLKPEYIGSGLGYYTSGPGASGAAAPASPMGPTGDPAANSAALQAILATKGGGITVLAYSPAADQNAFVVRPDTASKFSLTKMSDTTAVQDQLKWGLATECPTNPLCGAPGGALQADYGLTAQTIQKATLLSACDTPMVDALNGKTIDVGELCSTQPDIAKNGWVLLQDDKHSQPAENIAPLVRNDYLAKVDKASFEQILNSVSAKMDTATLTSLNAQFTFDKKDIPVIAKAWLVANGFVH